jgi:TonB family protein
VISLLEEPGSAARRRRVLALGLALAIHAAPLAFAVRLAPSAPEELSLEDTGVPMVIEFADAAVMSDSEAREEAAANDGEEVTPTPETDARLSARQDQDLPVADASIEKPPEPDLAAAQKRTLQETDKPAEEQTSEAMEAREADMAASAAQQSVESQAMDAVAETTAAPTEGSSKKAAAEIRSWQRSTIALIGRHKGYPRQSRRDREEGAVEVRVVIDRQGNLIAASVEKPARFALLNEEAIAIIRRSAPLPAPPASVTGAEIVLYLPIVFALK